jgi:hypothetical protein
MARFMAKTIQVRECLEWTGNLNSEGYGRFYDPDSNRKELAHRWLWKQLVGPLDSKTFLCHHCDNRRCVELSHLFPGSNSDNMQDCLRKGRWQSEVRDQTKRRGENEPHAKLTEANVRAIREERQEGATLKSLGEQYGVSLGTIWRVVQRLSWNHVP